MQKLKSVEILRCLAAMLVVFFHTQIIAGRHMTQAPFDGMFGGGSRGVDLFFVLSGFIIGYVHKGDLGQPNRLANYIFNRAARIFPAVWIMTGLTLALYIAGYGGAVKAGKLAAYNVFASFALLPQLGDALVNVTWTLKYEVFFYLIFSTMIINKRLGFTLLLLWQLSALILGSHFSIHQLGVAGFYFTSLCLEFGIGLVCAWILDEGPRARKDESKNSAFLWLLAAIGAIMFLLGMGGGAGVPHTFSGNDAIARHAWSINMLCALGSAFLTVSLILLERCGRFKVPKIFIFLGNASYSIYIVHYPIITLVFALIVRNRLPLNDIVCLGAAGIGVIAGCVFHSFVDKPIQKILRAKVRPAVARLASA
jgi:peptidoglycan/LPS O-acetylase OafA/YrhL